MESESSFGPFVLDRGSKALLREGKPVVLGQRGYALLEAMLNATDMAKKDELMESAWPGTIVEESNLTVQIAALRKALGRRPDGQEWIVTVPRLGYRLIRSGGPLPASVADARGGGPPSVAILPFTNIGGEASDEYFADGIVEDLTTALSRFGTFSVVSRSSAFVYKNRAVDIRQAAKELGVRYVLEGGVRRQDRRVRVTANLLDAESGAHLWADKFDGDLEDIFDFQDRITETVVGLVEPKIRIAEIERVRRRAPGSLDAYDLYLRALPHVYGMDFDSYEVGYELLKRAIKLDPDFSIAIAFAAWSLEKRITLSMPPLSEDDNAECVRLARAALVSDPDEPLVLAIAGFILLSIAGEFETGLAMVRRAVAANPNNLVVLNLCGTANLMSGDLEEASGCHLRAIKLSPNAPDAFWALSGKAAVELQRGNFEQAVDWALRSLQTSNDWPVTYWALVPAYAKLGKMNEARAALQRLLQLAPSMSAGTMLGPPPPHPERWRLIMEGLIAAGLPS